MRSFCLAALLVFASTAPLPAQGTAIPLDAFMGRGLALHAQVNGQDGYFLFDTGGGVTNVSPQFAAKIGCKPWGQISGFAMMAQRIDMQRCDNVLVRIGPREIRRETIGVFDGSGMMPPDAPHLDGTIALDSLEGTAFRVSLRDHTLTLLDGKDLQKATKGCKPLPLHLVRDAEGMSLSVNLPVTTSLGTAWFELDSGNTSPIALVGKHLAAPLKLDPTSGPNKKSEQTTLHLADGTAWTGDVRVFDLILDGNLGTTFLSRYDVTIDIATKKAWLTPN